SNFFLFLLFPVDEAHYFRMVQIETHHFGGAPGGATTFYCPGCTVSYFEEAHESAGCTTTAQLFTITTDIGEVGAYSGTIFEDACLTNPQVHNSAIIYQIIFNTQNETRMGLRSFVS